MHHGLSGAAMMFVPCLPSELNTARIKTLVGEIIHLGDVWSIHSVNNLKVCMIDKLSLHYSIWALSLGHSPRAWGEKYLERSLQRNQAGAETAAAMTAMGIQVSTGKKFQLYF